MKPRDEARADCSGIAGERPLGEGMLKLHLFPVLLLLMIGPVSGADAVIAFADKDPVLSSRSSVATVPLTISNGEASVLLRTASIRTHDGIAIAPDAISFPLTSTRLVPGRTAAISVNADPVRLSRQGSYPVTVEVTDPAGKPLNPPQLTFRYVVPDVTLQLEHGGTLIWTVRRPYPWAPASEQRGYALRATPSDSNFNDLRGAEANLSVGSDKGTETPDGARISRVTIDKQTRRVLATVTVPPGAKELLGALRIDGPALKQELVQPVIVRVKDWWPFPLLVVAVGYILSFLTTNWTTERQQELLNQIRRRQIHQAIQDLADGTGRPRMEFAEVEGLLHQADVAATSGDVTYAKTVLQQASDALDVLRVAPSGQGGAAFTVCRSALINEERLALRVRHGDFWLAALGATLTVLLAFWTVWQRESFSGLGDYIVAFFAGFGLDQSVKGLVPVLNRLRGSAF